MALAVLSDTIGDLITDQIDGSVSAPTIKTQWFSDTQSTWKDFDVRDIESRKLSKSNENNRYQVQSYLPPTKKISIVINNFDQSYNPDSGTSKSEILQKNRLIRAWTGFNMPESGGIDTLLTDDYVSSTKFVNTIKSGSTVQTDVSLFLGTCATAADLGQTVYFPDYYFYSNCDSDSSFTSPTEGFAMVANGSPSYSTGLFSTAFAPSTTAAWTFDPSTFGFFTSVKTVSMWIYPTSNTGGEIFNVNDIISPGGSGQWELDIAYSSGNLNISDEVSGSHINPSYSLAVPLDTWTHIAYSVGSLSKVYIDGVLTATGTYLGLGSETPDSKGAIGNNISFNSPFNGRIDEVMFWDYEKTSYADIDYEGEIRNPDCGEKGEYGSASYGALGYYTKTYTLPETEEAEATNFSLVSNSNKAKLRYRIADNSGFLGAAWSTFQTLSTGTNNFVLDSEVNDNYFQYLVTFFGNTYGVENISSSVLTYTDSSQLFKKGVYVLDEPVFESKVSCEGRDYLKKALETEINLPDLTSTIPISTAVTQVLDRVNIPYDTATWDLTATTVSLSAALSENVENISGLKAMDYLMDALNGGNDDWVFRFNDDGQGEIKIVPTATEADFLAHYYFHLISANKTLNSDKQLQRITAINKNLVVNSESLLKSVSGVATSSLTVTYSDAIYVRYEDNNSRILSETDRTNGSLSLSLSTAGSYDIDVYGCTPKNAITDEIWQERGNSQNIIKNNGNTFRKENPFFTNDIAKGYCDYTIGRFGDPAKRVTCSMLMNPTSEINDNYLVFSRETSDNTLYNLNSETETWSQQGGLMNQLILEDKGISFDNFDWDRNGILPGVNDAKYDKSLIWEYDLGVDATSDNFDYDVYKPVRMA